MTRGEADNLALYGVPGVGAKTHAQLLKHFGSATSVFAQPIKELMTLNGVGKSVAGNIGTFDRATFVDDQQERMDRAGAAVIFRGTEDYPPMLDAFPSAPPVLFTRGDISALHMSSLAFVGTRGATPYGKKMTIALVTGSVNAGFCIVSGLAAGIDSISHRTALENDGVTVAVFGCGVDNIYPPQNRQLALDIQNSGGCLVSHFPMGMEGLRGNFPARNSVIAGLSQGTVVVEAGQKSGALITADLALRAKRKLFAVPGPADAKKSIGVNALLGKGALPATDITVILAAFGRRAAAQPKQAPKIIPQGLPGEIMKILVGGPLDVEAICVKLNEPVQTILQELTELEIDGLVGQQPGKIFSLT